MIGITPVFQPPKSNQCGQACVAALAEIPLSAAIAVVGTKGATTTRQIISALESLGFECGDSLIRNKAEEPLPKLCMCVMHFEDSRWGHWVIWDDGIFVDPARGTYPVLLPKTRITSYLPIRVSHDGKSIYRVPDAE